MFEKTQGDRSIIQLIYLYKHYFYILSEFVKVLEENLKSMRVKKEAETLYKRLASFNNKLKVSYFTNF